MKAQHCVQSNRGLQYAGVTSSGSLKVSRAAQHDIRCSGLAACSPAKGLPFVADAKRGRNDPTAQPSWEVQGEHSYTFWCLERRQNLSTVLSQLAASNHSNGYYCNSGIQHISSQTTENKGVLVFFTYDYHFVWISIHKKMNMQDEILRCVIPVVLSK